MDHEARLKTVLNLIAEHKETEQDLRYRVTMGLKRREYHSISKASKVLIELDETIEELQKEALELERDIKNGET